MAKTCTVCGKRAYSDYCILHKPRKPIPPQSAKEIDYQEWKESVARPYLIDKYGNVCSCCGKDFGFVKLDIEHTLTKGSRPDLKRNLDNMTLMCRWCHSRKTDGKGCLHD